MQSLKEKNNVLKSDRIITRLFRVSKCKQVINYDVLTVFIGVDMIFSFSI